MLQMLCITAARQTAAMCGSMSSGASIKVTWDGNNAGVDVDIEKRQSQLRVGRMDEE